MTACQRLAQDWILSCSLSLLAFYPIFKVPSFSFVKLLQVYTFLFLFLLRAVEHFLPFGRRLLCSGFHGQGCCFCFCGFSDLLNGKILEGS